MDMLEYYQALLRAITLDCDTTLAKYADTVRGDHISMHYTTKVGLIVSELQQLLARCGHSTPNYDNCCDDPVRWVEDHK